MQTSEPMRPDEPVTRRRMGERGEFIRCYSLWVIREEEEGREMQVRAKRLPEAHASRVHGKRSLPNLTADEQLFRTSFACAFIKSRYLASAVPLSSH